MLATITASNRFGLATRLLEHAGALYIYLPASGQVDGEESVQLLQKELHYLPESVKRKDYNYRTPESTLIGEAKTGSKIPATGTD